MSAEPPDESTKQRNSGLAVAVLALVVVLLLVAIVLGRLPGT